MPELPEVETTVLLLRKKTLNKVFVCVWGEKKNNLSKKLKGKRIEKITRHGKGIFFHLSSKEILFIHLRMTGHLLYGKWERKGKEWLSEEKIMQHPKNGFLRYIFFLSNGKQLALSDQRKFATINLISRKEKEDYLSRIGPDPLEIKKEDFFRILKERRGRIKSLLMNQQFISGIGNIYASEILFKAKIRPERNADSLKQKEMERLYLNMKTILRKGLSLQGDSTSDFRLLDGRKGGYQEKHLVYNRKNLPCPVCKKKITKTILGGRGTYFCPKCQK